MKKEEKNSDFQKHVKYLIKNIGFRKELYVFIENLTSLITSGMGLSEALLALSEEIKSRRLRVIIAHIKEDIDSGISFAVALDKVHVLPERMISLIRLGELSGKLVENLKVLVMQNEKDQMFKSKVRSSLTYAVIIFSFTIIVGGVTSWFVLPKLTDVFSEAGVDLPLVTRMLIWLGVFIGKFGYFILPLFIIGLIIAFYFLFSFPRTRFIGHNLLFRIPIIKNLIKNVEIARFGFLFGTMLKAGLPIDDAINALPGITTFSNYKKFYIYLMGYISEFNSFQKSIYNYPKIKKLFPVSARQMIIAGEKSGKLDEALLKIGSIYEVKTEETARNLPIVLEPLLLLIIGIGVAIIALAIIMPIYKLVEVY